MITQVGSKYKLTSACGTKIIGYFNSRNDAVDFNHQLMLLEIQKQKGLESQYRAFGYKHSIWSTK